MTAGRFRGPPIVASSGVREGATAFAVVVLFQSSPVAKRAASIRQKSALAVRRLKLKPALRVNLEAEFKANHLAPGLLGRPLNQHAVFLA